MRLVRAVLAAVPVAAALLGGLPAAAAGPSIDSIRAKAESGDANAQMDLAWAYTVGRGVHEDAAQAAIWCRKAAEQGLAAAQNCVGSNYQSGDGLPQDYAEAVKWYQKAAAQGDAEANTNLGFMYDGGLGVEQDRRRAVELYRTGAEAGSLNGMLDLGLSLWHGEGIEANLVEAHMWLDLARFYTQLSPNKQLKWRVRHELDELKKQMTPAQLREAADKAKEWDRAHRSKS